MTHSLTLEVPDDIYQPIVEEAEAEGRKVEDIALERLANTSPKRQKDSLDEFVGFIKSDVSDWADNHDKYLGDELAKDLSSR